MNISGHIQVLGIVGNPVAHSASPRLHNSAFKFLGLDLVYLPFCVSASELKSAINGIRALNLVGVNVTVPHKQTVIPFLDELDPVANAIGAVNTIVNRDGRLIGFNTDAPGFVQALQIDHGFLCMGRRAVIIGAGGSARAIAFGLRGAGIRDITIINRSIDAAHELASAVASPSLSTSVTPLDSVDATKALRNAELVVQTTSVGMDPNKTDCPIADFSWVTSNSTIVDIIYSPDKTRFLAECESRGGRISNGSGMLISQAALAFELFCNVPAPVELMRKAFYVNEQT